MMALRSIGAVRSPLRVGVAFLPRFACLVIFVVLGLFFPRGVPSSGASRYPFTSSPSDALSPQALTSSSIYYVAPNGNNGWSGTLPAPNAAGTDGPWRTIQYAARASRPGDTVYVRGGTYHEWVWLDAADSGTESAPKTFVAYPGEQAVLDGAAYPTAWSHYSGNIWYTDASGIDFNWDGQARLVWQDEVWLPHSASLATLSAGSWWFDTNTRRLYVWPRNGGDPAQYRIAVAELRSAFFLNAASWVVIDGFWIRHYYRGISQEDSSGQQRTMEGLTVRHCTIEHVGEGIGLVGASFGTWGYSHYATIEYNTVRDTQSDAMWVGSGTHNLVRGNRISDVKQAWYRGFVSAAIILGNADDSIVECNVISDVHALGIDVEHFYGADYGNRNIVRRNVVHDAGAHAIAILGANDTQIENNVVYNVRYFAILVNTEAGPALRNRIINNTLYHSDYAGIGIIEGSPDQSHGLVPQDTVVRNNILADMASVGISNEGEGTQADYNLYWQVPEGLAVWNDTVYATLSALRAIGQEAHGLVSNPAFSSAPGDMDLTSGSPAIDRGSNADAPAKDMRGFSRPWDGNGDSVAVADIGAYEWRELYRRPYLPAILKRYVP